MPREKGDDIDYAAVAARIKKRMVDLGIKNNFQLSKLTRLSTGIISEHMRGGRDMSTSTIYRYAKALDTSVDYLLEGQESSLVDLETIHQIVQRARRPQPEPRLPRDFGRIPLLTTIPAGEPNHWIDTYPMGYADEYVDSYDLRGEYLFALKVTGDSMLPRLYPGDIVVVDPVREFVLSPRGKIGVVQKEQEEAMVKWIVKRQDFVCIESQNPQYKHLDFIIPVTDDHYRFLKIVSFRRQTANDDDF